MKGKVATIDKVFNFPFSSQTEEIEFFKQINKEAEDYISALEEEIKFIKKEKK
jgi:hypothetical protein|tara:strand:- start:34 stop:192 length:159 start_codon:yes stop_codon:yes gene_type:complete